MSQTTGIRIRRVTLERLNKNKAHPRETHDDVISFALVALESLNDRTIKRARAARRGAVRKNGKKAS